MEIVSEICKTSKSQAVCDGQTMALNVSPIQSDYFYFHITQSSPQDSSEL